MKFKFWAAIGLAATLFSCDDTTTGVGGFISDNEKINAFADSYTISSRTELLDSVYSRTRNAYLGRYTDPDFGLYSANFIAQINCPEGFRLPENTQSIEGTTLAILYRSFYGDSLATMRVRIDSLNTVINDNGEDKSLYYTTFDPTKYYDADKAPMAEKNYAPIDYTVSDSIRNDQAMYLNVMTDLGKNFSDYLFQKYNENNHAYFNDAHAFINNVLKGFYFHITQGEGSVLYIEDIQMRMTCKRLVERKSTGKLDSIVYQIVPMAASKEVFMSTSLESTDRLKEMAKEKGHTYLKTPAGLCTEVTFPLREMYEAHKNDTLNSVSMTITKYKEAGQNSHLTPYKTKAPDQLLLIRKADFKEFFEKNKTFDNKTSFVGYYDPNVNGYTFTKLNRLISTVFSDLKNNKELDPDWDKVLLIPILMEKDPQGNVINVTHNMEFNSARLFGGEEGEKLNIDIIYTQPKRF